MLEIKRNNADSVKIYAETFEQEAFDQVKNLANFEPYLDSTIRIMPDAHAGAGCTIGTTMTLHGKVTPNLVGVDIGCGMLVTCIGQIMPDLKRLDKDIRENVPSGFNIHDEAQRGWEVVNDLKCKDFVDIERAARSIGTLGGGNHFIELAHSDKDGGWYYLVIHSGSRNLGVQVCKYYQGIAVRNMQNRNSVKNEIVRRLKAEGREKDIQSELKKVSIPAFNRELAYLEGQDFDDYIHDMEIVQKYASRNRKEISNIIMLDNGLRPLEQFETIHNYIDTQSMILRKGAVRALAGERLIIPMNMRDGSLICIGKGNHDWNCSAPHGAGRIMSRAAAKEQLSMDDYRHSMEGIYTTSVNDSTIDEAPMAYKPMGEILRCIEPTVDVVDVIKPVYNFKASN